MSAPEKVPPPDAGYYRDVSFETYLSWDAASSSALSKLLISPAHMKAYLEEPPETEALRIGRAMHAAVLEPDHFPSRYVEGGQCEAETQKGARCSKGASMVTVEGEQVCGTHAKGKAAHPTLTLLSEPDWASCLGARDALYGKPRIAALLNGPGDIELSFSWTDEDSGAPCKARWDRHSPEIAGGTVVDYKSAYDASPRTFERSIFRFGYYMQAALYLMAGEVFDAPVEHFAIIAQEKKPPYAVAAYRLTQAAIDTGREQVRALLRRYAECEREQSWPDYPDEIRDISIPEWAWYAADEDLDRLIGREAA